MISLSSASFSYADRVILDDISLDMNEQRIGIVGANGSGKTTVARLAAGLILPTKGKVLVNGHDTAREVKTVRSLVRFVFQDPDLQIVMPTVGEDLRFSLRSARLPSSEVDARVTRWLDAYGLESHRDHPAHLLSGGQKQLLAIAAILITEPQIVVFDEPTTGLDLRNKRTIMDAITALTQHTIVVSHDLEFLESFDRVIVIDTGRVAADDTPASALREYKRIALNRV